MGKRRNANGSDAACGSISSSTTRGFTGHEEIDGACLVNMNARIYEPSIGRFMSPDSFVGDFSNLQDWNAYTYVNNNPLSFTDPTGHATVPSDPQPTSEAGGVRFVEERNAHEPATPWHDDYWYWKVEQESGIYPSEEEAFADAVQSIRWLGELLHNESWTERA